MTYFLKKKIRQSLMMSAYPKLSNSPEATNSTEYFQC